MSHRPENNRKFQDFRTKIREADSHEDAEAVMAELAPENIITTCDRLIEEEGRDKDRMRLFENAAFYVYNFPDSGEWIVARKKNDVREDPEADVVFHKSRGAILVFKPMRAWNILNFLEEIAETGEVSI